MFRIVFLGVLALCQVEASIFTLEQLNDAFYNDVNITDSGTNWIFYTHGVPEHDHGPFPSPDNPNSVSYQNHVFTIPKVPTLADTPGCLALGSIGVAINGVPYFNPYSGFGFNAVEGENSEVFDSCDGHPAPQGDYHYHQLPSCLYNNETRQLLGIALDGYPIYNNIAENGDTLTSVDLDLCHGRFVDGDYYYVITTDFPYIMGCYKGDTIEPENPGGDERPPPQSAMGAPPGDGGGGGDMGGCELPCYANVSEPDGCLNSGEPTNNPSENGVHRVLPCITMLMVLLISLFQ